jgi:PAS domain S-box-containing protein
MDSNDLLQEVPASALTGERKLKAILDSVWEAVVTVDRLHRIASLNRAAERLIGITEAEAMGKDCRVILRANFGPAQAQCPMGDLSEAGSPQTEVGGTLVRADGRIVPVSASWAFLEDTPGNILGFVISFRSYEEIERLADLRRSRFPFREIVGKTARLQEIFDLVDAVKETDSTVLIEGESGTGKGLFARAIHDLSPRRDGPFVKVNCAALTETLLESELFGHVKGAFTGAISDKVGRFEAASGGTIFLDEIGEIPPSLQAKLLHAVQDREFQRVGSSRTLRADFRVIAATNRDLLAAVREGRFREDLFYRLHVIPLRIPPLRERKEDIPLLVEHILKGFRRRGLDRVRAASPEAMRCLMAHAWPGNIRELENVLERAAVVAKGNVISAADLPEEVTGTPRRAEVAPPPTARDEPDDERARLVRVLDANRWNRGAAAAALGVDRTTLWRRMKRLGLA